MLDGPAPGGGVLPLCIGGGGRDGLIVGGGGRCGQGTGGGASDNGGVVNLDLAAQLGVDHGVGHTLREHVEGQHGQQNDGTCEGGSPPAACQYQGTAVGDDVTPGGVGRAHTG